MGRERYGSREMTPGWTTARPLPLSADSRSTFGEVATQEETGLTMWMNPTHNYDLLVIRRDGQRQAVVLTAEDFLAGPSRH